MRVFVINLVRRAERMEFMRLQFSRLGINFERMEAIDGAAMPAREIEQSVNRFRWYCAQGYRARNGEIGCALSHQLVYRKMIDENISAACIVEDDITLSPKFGEVAGEVGGFLSSAGDSPTVVLLSKSFQAAEHPSSGTCQIYQVARENSTCGYALNVAAAKRLLEINFPLKSTIDDWPRWRKRGGISLYGTLPRVCLHEEYASAPSNPAFASDTIDENTVFVKDLPPLKKLFHKAKRVVGWTIDAVLPVWA